MKKVMLSLATIILVSTAVLSTAGSVKAWAWGTHRFIAIHAKNAFTEDSFFSNHVETLKEWCTMPDQDKSFMPDGGGEDDWHWLDAISYHPLETTGGKLPWAMEWIFDNIVQYLKDNNWDTAAQLMGAICHFTGDATMPLHATSDYNPGGRHGEFEGVVDQHLFEIEVSEYAPQELDNIFGAAMATLEESFGYTGYTSDKLNYWLAGGILWNDTIKSITENRLQAGVQFTTNIWYTAMIRAGLTIGAPTLESPENCETATTHRPTFTWTSTGEAYQLELSTDNNFASDVIVLKVDDNFYTLQDDSLENGVWYWRVRSGDSSTHVGLWSGVRKLTVSAPPSPQPSPEEEPSKFPWAHAAGTIIIVAVVIIVFWRYWKNGR